MEHRVIFSATEDGEKPIIDVLDTMRGQHDVLHRLVAAGPLKLTLRDNHGPPLTSPIHGSTGLFELRVGRTDIARVFLFFRPHREIVCTSGYFKYKKTDKLDPREIARAERYKADWEQRHP